MDIDESNASTLWRQISLEFIGLGLVGATVAMLLTQSSYEATLVLEQLPSSLGSVLDAVRQSQRASDARVILSTAMVGPDKLRLNCRSERLEAAKDACARALRAAEVRAHSRVASTQLRGADPAQSTAFYAFSALPAFCWLGFRVRRVQRMRAQARADLEGWSREISHVREVADLPASPSVSKLKATIAGFSPVAAQDLYEEAHAGLEAQPPAATASQPPSAATALTTRVVFRIGGNPFRADDSVLTRQTRAELQALCQQLMAATPSRSVIRVASNVGSRYAKSQVAAQLAMLLAENPETRVLIVEGDVDAPALHRVMRLEAPVGLGLSEQLQRLLNNDGKGTLSVMRVDANLHALVESRGGSPTALGLPLFAEVIAHQREHNDFIVVDGPVLDTWPDADHLSQCVDRVVMVAAAGTRLQDTQLLAARHFRSETVLGTIKAGDWAATGS